MRILIADDEASILKFLKSSLEERGHSVDCATQGRQALDMVKQNKYDLAILDFNMPEITGMELIIEMKKIGLETKTVMMTGDAIMEVHMAQSIGADEYLQKPFSENMIFKLVDKYDPGKNQPKP